MKLSHVPCAKCGVDTLFIGLKCSQCGSAAQPIVNILPKRLTRKSLKARMHAEVVQAHAKR